MKIIHDNIWSYRDQGWLVITTNGSVKSNGECVMGRGLALQAKQRYPFLAMSLGETITKHGNHVYCFMEYKLFTFPVKHLWNEKANLELISHSWKELIFKASVKITDKIFLTKPGCMNGQLDWKDVEPLLTPWPDNFTLVDLN